MASPRTPVQMGAQGRADELQHYNVLRPYCEAPRRTFVTALGCHCFLLILFIVLNAALGTTFLNQTTEVALHIWNNKWKVRVDAVAEGEKTCTYDLSARTEQSRQEMPRLPAGMKEYSLEVVYNAQDGNMLTVDKLLKVKELEDYIVNHPDYAKFCMRAAGSASCKTALSSINSCNPALCGMLQNAAGSPGPQAGCGGVTAQGMTPANDCSPTKSVPAGLFQCATPGGCSRDQWTINASFLERKVKAYSEAAFLDDYPETAVLATLDAQFSVGSATAPALRAKFEFGFPLEGYTSTGDRAEEQVQLVEEFMEDAFFDKLNSYNSQAGDDPPFLIGYAGGPLADLSIQALLATDFMMVGMAFFVVLLYVLFMTSSVFYSLMAMGQVFLCFLTGFILYRVVFGNFFGTFHIMAIFLLVGIGVDNVFVFNDHFQAALQVDPRFKDDFLGRMTWTWKHAGQAMGVTSLTTATSFFCNGMSAFPGIAAFGIFAGCLVVTMYISMVFFWPAVVACNEYTFKGKPFLCGIGDKLDKVFANTSKEAQDSANDVKEGEGKGPGQNELAKPAMVRFFEDHFSMLIVRHRVKILLIFFIVSIFMFVQVSKLTPEKTKPDLLPGEHPIAQYADLMRNKFVRGGSMFNTKVQMVFGFDKDPLDRKGRDTTGEGHGEGIDKPGILGDVSWNPNFVNSTGGINYDVVLGGFPCFVQLCDSAEEFSAERKSGGPSASRIQGCFPRDVQRFLLNAGRNSTWTNIASGDSGAFWQVLHEMEAANPGYFQEAKQYAMAEKVGADVLWRFFRTELKLTSDRSLAHDDGIALSETWENWLAQQMATGHCAQTADTFWGFVTALDFHQFKVTETLLGEMVSGISISIAVALVVLVLATGNIIVGTAAAFTIGMIVIWVMAMIPTFGWELGIVENIVLVMVPGLAVDFTAHLSEAYNQAKYDDREHRVVHALEHSGVSIVSGAVSTTLAGLCLMATQIIFFKKFGALILCTILYAVLFSLFFFPSLMALCGPTGDQGDWHKYIHPILQRDIGGAKKLHVQYSRTLSKIGQVVPFQQS